MNDVVQTNLDLLLKEIDALRSREEIREIVYRYDRAVDRLDRELLLSCYHPDAVDDHGFFKASSADEIADLIINETRDGFLRSFYSTGNILIDLDGDVARVESYCISAKIMKQPDDNGNEQMRLSGVRYIDRFERRAGVWRIAHRKLTSEWGFFQPTPTKTVGPFVYPPNDMVPPYGRRDRSDPSYFGA